MKSYDVPFDRVKLTLSSTVYFMLFLLMPALCLYVSLNPLVIFFLLTICWFTLKAGIRSCKRLFKNKPICSMTEKEIQINSLTEDTKIMKWKDVEKVVMKQKHHGVQFLLFGDHIDHASGVYMIHIDYPFCYKKLDCVTQELLTRFSKHHIPVETLKEDKRGTAHVSYTTKN